MFKEYFAMFSLVLLAPVIVCLAMYKVWDLHIRNHSFG
jgi:hypothetical protein